MVSEYKKSLGWCEEGQTYCSVSEKAYKDGRADAIEEFREYLKTVIPCEMPKDIWDFGIDNTCDRMLKEQK